MTRLSLLFALLLSSVACAGPRAYGYVSFGAPPPYPRAYYAPRPVMPGPGYVWVNGYWSPGPSRWMWTPGTWMMPPRPRAVWVAPRYHGRSYYRGHWR